LWCLWCSGTGAGGGQIPWLSYSWKKWAPSMSIIKWLWPVVFYYRSELRKHCWPVKDK
jgi:hypothetical protein